MNMQIPATPGSICPFTLRTFFSQQAPSLTNYQLKSMQISKQIIQILPIQLIPHRRHHPTPQVES